MRSRVAGTLGLDGGDDVVCCCHDLVLFGRLLLACPLDALFPGAPGQGAGAGVGVVADEPVPTGSHLVDLVAGGPVVGAPGEHPVAVLVGGERAGGPRPAGVGAHLAGGPHGHVVALPDVERAPGGVRATGRGSPADELGDVDRLLDDAATDQLGLEHGQPLGEARAGGLAAEPHGVRRQAHGSSWWRAGVPGDEPGEVLARPQTSGSGSEPMQLRHLGADPLAIGVWARIEVREVLDLPRELGGVADRGDLGGVRWRAATDLQRGHAGDDGGRDEEDSSSAPSVACSRIAR